MEQKRTLYNIIKRIFDVIMASVLSVVLLPVFIVLSAAIVLQSRGGAIYVHKRIGQYGRIISVYKLRSMISGADDLEAQLNDADLEAYYREFKLRDDPRITPVGAFLRRWSLDELPQLWNILKGDMSFVGPRPLVEEEYSFYTEEESKKLKSVVPGLTGYWQAYARNCAQYETGERQRMELYYVDNASLLLDIRIILKTFITVFSGRGYKPDSK